MAKKKYKPYKNLMRASIGLGGAAIGIGVGSSVVEKAGGSAAPLATLGGYMKPAARVVGGGILINTLMDFKEGTTRKLKRRRR
ncbi:unnamed protein product [marine sediment metagenome]|uniref:Uncharacterized protein n=1 Tax=marine sediment metagenome TaxID=412755 RepID=X0XWN1_9ZZZZ